MQASLTPVLTVVSVLSIISVVMFLLKNGYYSSEFGKTRDVVVGKLKSLVGSLKVSALLSANVVEKQWEDPCGETFVKAIYHYRRP